MHMPRAVQLPQSSTILPCCIPTLALVGLFVAGVVVAGETAWLDWDNCGMCSNMASTEGLMDHMTWEQHDISKGVVSITVVDGEYLDLEFGVENKQAGEAVQLMVRRDGELQEIEVPLKEWGARMKLSMAHEEKPEFLVRGGYVFVPLSMNYVLFQRSNRDELLYYLQHYYRTMKKSETREQLVLLSRVLPHESTRYRRYRNKIVASVDGVAPLDFKHFVELIEKAKGNRVKVEFEGVNVAPLILDRKKLEKSHPAILKSTGITQERHVAKGDG